MNSAPLLKLFNGDMLTFRTGTLYPLFDERIHPVKVLMIEIGCIFGNCQGQVDNIIFSIIIMDVINDFFNSVLEIAIPPGWDSEDLPCNFVPKCAK